jgi:sterol desaturase/sphingolipid hydroxylase (fatty acid hydroxylase superfamily)
MNFPSLMIERGESLQYILFFGFLTFFLAAEAVMPRRTTPPERGRRWPTNLGLTLTNVLALGFVPFSFISAALWARGANIGLLNSIDLPVWALVSTTLLLRGLISTGTHLLAHKIPWLWRIHRVHHLDTELDVTSTVRFHPLEFFVNPLIGVPIVLLFGLPAWVLAFYELLDIVVTLFSHSNIRLPKRLNRVLQTIIVTPDLHRIHHSSWQPETDSNYGAVFPIWDLVFGTFRATPRDRQKDMELGLRELRKSKGNTYLPLLLSPFRKNLTPLASRRRPTRTHSQPRFATPERDKDAA